MYTVLEGMRLTARALWPVMPESASAMLDQLGQGSAEVLGLEQEAEQWSGLEVRTRLAKKSNLFPRQDRLEQTEGQEGQSGSQTAGPRPRAPEINIEDFQRLELKVAKIVSAEAVPKADKLYKLEVDAGEDRPRQVISGLAGSFGLEELPGQLVVLVCNLKPKKVFGHLSQGMVLAVHAPEGLQLVQPQGQVPPGSPIS
jgi:methionyl-tRNA synthetase